MWKLLTLAANAFLLHGFVLLLPARAEKTETFNSAASAAANVWVVAGNGVDGQTAGFINTNDAGGVAAGEAQFDVLRGAELSYLDTNLGMVANGNGGFSITGNLNYLGGPGAAPDLGFPPILGFSSSPSDFVGIMFRGDDADLQLDLSWGLRFATTADEIRVNGGGDFSRIIAPNVSRTFSLVYDPNAGEFGTITASVSDAGGPIVHFLSEINRTLLNEAAYTRAGIFHQGNTPDPEHGIFLRLDDLTYTGVAGEPVGVAGDYNGNLVVDAADYAVWRDSLGQSGAGLPADGDGNEMIETADYDFWKARFGNTSGSGGGSGAVVPEPAGWMLLFLAASALGLHRRLSL